MSLGLCCQYLEPITKRNGDIVYENSSGENGLQYGQFLKDKYSKSYIQDTWVSNCYNLLKLVKKVHSKNIKCFRISSNLLPLFDVVNNEDYTKDVITMLQSIGKFAKDNNIRLTTHPDQFCVLSSDNPNVIENSKKILNYHAWIMDQMGLSESPFYAINIHGGKRGNIQTLIDSIKALPNNVKNRLTLENDEKCYDVKQLYNVFEDTGVPTVFDSHHFTFNTASLTIEEALKLSNNTWQNIKQLTHLSNTEPDLINGSYTERRKHSYYINNIPECQRLANNNNELDIEVEAKGKNLAIFKMIKDFDVTL